MKKQRIFSAITLSLALSVPMACTVLQSMPVYAVEGEVTSVEQNLLIPGFVYSNRITQTSGGQLESYTLSLDPNSTAYPIALQGSGSIYAGGNITKAITYAENLGYNVLGAINSDYFSFSTGVPFGIVIEDGIYKSSPSTYSSIIFGEEGTTILGEITIPITITNHRSGEVTRLTNFNKTRTETGGLYLFNSDFSTTTRTTTDGIMVRMVPTFEEIHGESEGKLTVNRSLSMTVTEVIETSDPWDIGEHDYILTASSTSGWGETMDDFEVGDKITLTTVTYEESLQGAKWATGGGDVMISQGGLTDSSTWEHVTEGLAPRTAFGVKSDGSMVFYVADGRQSPQSVGLSQKDLANHLLEEGCVSAVNLDGGGSSSFAVTSLVAPNLLGSTTLENSPSDGSLRNCATFLLIVDPQDPNHLTFESSIENVMVQSYVELGRVMVRDVNETILEIYTTDSTVETLGNLGVLEQYTDEDGYIVYIYSPLEPGVEEFELTGYEGLVGEQNINVVDTLTSLKLLERDSGEVITSAQLATKQTLELEFQAEIHEQEVFVNGDALAWRVIPADGVSDTANIGFVTADGVYTAGDSPCYVEVEIAGITSRVEISIYNMFEDVPEDHWAFDAILYLYENKLISGMSDTEYGMGEQIRRGDFVLMLYGALGSPEVTTDVDFSDVDFLDYYYDAIAWASSAGVVSGMGDGVFGAKSSITREQALLILYKAYGTLELEVPVASLATLTQYRDQEDISSYALQALASLSAQGVISDVTSYLYPTTPLTRESMALFLYEMLHYEKSELEAPTSFSMYPNEIYLLPNGTYTLLPLLEPAGSGAEITWSSSDPSAVSVSASGVISNVFTGTGSPVVTVTGKIGTLSASCIVRCVAEGTTIPEIPPVNLPSVEEDEEEKEEDSDTESGLISTASTGMVVDAPGGLNVRTDPSSEGEIVARLPEDVIVTLYGKTEDNWYQVSYQYTDPSTNVITNIQGYVMGEYIEEKVIVGTVVDAEVGLNLRAGAGTAFESLMKLPNGSQVAVLQVFTDWYKVQVNANGNLIIGFVSSEYLELS